MAARTPLGPRDGPFRLGVIGNPVAHSLSPALQQPALDLLRIPAVYERWQTSPDELAARVESLREADVLGANVTVPHKRAVLSLVDDLSPTARRAGAVNTIVNQAGRLLGENTDIHGFAASLMAALGTRVPTVALVLGAGGAARAVVLALEGLGVPEIVVANRDVTRGSELAADLAPAPVRPALLDNAALRREIPRAELLVNATSLGWRAGEAPIELAHLEALPEDVVVADLTYRDTDLLLAAASRGLAVIDGLQMLVHQGARAFELFTGRPAPLETMLAAARRAREA